MSAVSGGPLWAVVPAAGTGSRFGGDCPKQYLAVRGRAVLEWTLKALLGIPGLRGIVVALDPGDRRWDSLPLASDRRVRRCTGGRDRAESVLSGLLSLGAHGARDRDPVLVHDAARCCIRTEDILRLVAEAAGSEHGGLLATPVRDTLKRAGAGDRVVDTVDRAGLWQAQTPQLFPLGALRTALEDARRADVPVTDEAQAMERGGFRPRLVEGAADNIKLTMPGDRVLVEAILAARNDGNPDGGER